MEKAEMEKKQEKKQEKNQNENGNEKERVWKAAPESSEFLLQWGNRKRLRGPRVKDFDLSDKSNRRKITSRIDRLVVTASASASASCEKENNSHFLQSTTRFTRNSEGAVLRSNASGENRKSASPEKEDRYYATRGSLVGGGENEKIASMEGIGIGLGIGGGGGGVEDRGGGGTLVWPKLYISLTSKEKEEDFLAMKGCKPPHRPKKRAKIIQRSLLLVSPGAWLSDMSHERYEVREKKTSKKRPRGLKAMGSMESDSE